VEKCESVFDKPIILLPSNLTTTFIKYVFNFESIDQFFDEVFEIDETSVIYVSIEIDGTFVAQPIHIIYGGPKVQLLSEINKLEMAVNKTCNVILYPLYRSFIHELYSYTKNKLFREKIALILESTMALDASCHKYHLLCAKINYLFCSISTVSEYGAAQFDVNFDRGKQLSVGMCREVSEIAAPIPIQMQRSCTQSEQTAVYSESVADQVIQDGTHCCICLSNSKNIVYSCGHLATCVDCNDLYLYGETSQQPSLIDDGSIIHAITLPDKVCPICKTKINGYIKIKKIYKTCASHECNGIPMIMHLDCKQVIYCEPCWSNQLCVDKTPGKKRAIPRIQCVCGEEIQQFVKVHT
jgi:hypothetical protein